MSSIDVAVPCYQYGRFLEACVGSILGQGVPDLRILIIDNASTDGTIDVARRLGRRDARIEILSRERNLGPHASFNAGVAWARADYFMILCADDLLAPGALRAAAGILDRTPGAAFAYGQDVHWDGSQPLALPDAASIATWSVEPGSRFIARRCRNPEHYIAAGMVLVRTGAQKAAGTYRPELPHTDDFEMLLRLARYGSVARTNGVLGVKRIHAANRTHGFTGDGTRDLLERLDAIESFVHRDMDDATEAARLLASARRGLAQRAYWSGIKALLRRDGTGRAKMELAFRLNPSTRYLPPLRYLAEMDRGWPSILRTLLGAPRPPAS